MTEFKCKECGDEFDHEVLCQIHHVQTKHQSYELPATEHTMIIKSS